MQLTEQQRTDLDRQRSEYPGRKRFMLAFTPEQEEQYRRAVAEEMASRAANVRRARPTLEALREASFSGWLRRAIASSGMPQEDLASRTGSDVTQLNAFLRGEATLDSAVIDRLIAVLGLTPQLEEVSI
jgi:ribosome-binding protein aMBF1 (putative translation factor)